MTQRGVAKVIRQGTEPAASLYRTGMLRFNYLAATLVASWPAATIEIDYARQAITLHKAERAARNAYAMYPHEAGRSISARNMLRLGVEPKHNIPILHVGQDRISVGPVPMKEPKAEA